MVDVMPRAVAIAKHFCAADSIVAVEPLGNGLINDTYRVRLKDAAVADIVLQRINTDVFHQPKLVMANLRMLVDRAGDRLTYMYLGENRRWELPEIVPTSTGQDWWIDLEGHFWRATRFVAGTHTIDRIQSLDRASEVGFALGAFHALLDRVSAQELADTLPGFHITPDYLRLFDAAIATTTVDGSSEVQRCVDYIGDRRKWASVLEDAKARGELKLRAIHGDPKVNNILFDVNSERAIALIDLDTVKPGLVHYDIGDCLRSACQSTDHSFNVERCRAILHAYLSVEGNSLTTFDFDYLYDAIRLIPFELGLRFFTDYLNGDVYFKASYPTHNLDRALGQFALTSSIEAQESAIQLAIDELSP